MDALGRDSGHGSDREVRSVALERVRVVGAALRAAAPRRLARCAAGPAPRAPGPCRPDFSTVKRTY